jgi:hypothetical protein
VQAPSKTMNRPILYVLSGASIIAAYADTGAMLWINSTNTPTTISSLGTLTIPTSRTDSLVALVSMYANAPGAVTNVGFVGFNTVTATQSWVFIPSQFRSGCTPPAYTSTGAIFFTICDLNQLDPVSYNTTAFAVNVDTGAVLWQYRLFEANTSTSLLSDNILVDDVAGTVVFASSLYVYALNAASGAVISVNPYPTSYGALSFSLFWSSPLSSSSAATTAFFGLTTAGYLLSLDTSGALVAANNLHVGSAPLQSYQVSGQVADAVNGVFMFNYGNMSGYFTITVTSSSAFVQLQSYVIPYGVVSMSNLPQITRISGPPGGAQKISTVQYSTNYTTQGVTFATDGSGTGMTIRQDWTSAYMGRVWGTPAMFVNPGNYSDGLLVYVGLDDNVVRAIEPTYGTLVWSYYAMFANPSVYYNGMVGDWEADFLAVFDFSGNIFMLSLSTGTYMGEVPVGDYVSSVAQGKQFPPMYMSAVTLIEDAAASHVGPGFSFVYSISSTSIGPGVLLKVYVPSAANVNVDVASLIPWNITSFKDGYLSSFSSESVVGTVGTQQYVLTTNFGQVLAVSVADGSVFWSVSYPSGGYTMRTAAFSPEDSAYYAATTTSSGPNTYNYISRIDAATGNVMWSVNPCGVSWTGFALDPTSSNLYATCSSQANGKLLALDRGSGNVVWWSQPGSTTMVGGPTILSAGAVAYGLAGGGLTIVNSTTGAFITSYTLAGAAIPISSSTLNQYPSFTWTGIADWDGTIYATGGDDGYIYQVNNLLGSNNSPLPSASASPAPAGTATPTPSPSPSSSTAAAPGAAPTSDTPTIVGATLAGVAVVGASAAGVWWYKRGNAVPSSKFRSAAAASALLEADDPLLATESHDMNKGKGKKVRSGGLN